jgi:hypothetical protein
MASNNNQNVYVEGAFNTYVIHIKKQPTGCFFIFLNINRDQYSWVEHPYLYMKSTWF